MNKKKGPNVFFIVIIFVFFIMGPLINSVTDLSKGSSFGIFALFPLISFAIVIIIVFSVLKSLPKTLEKYNNMPGQEITIPVEFFEQDKPVMETHSDALFKDLYRRKIIYYENGKPVYEKHN